MSYVTNLADDAAGGAGYVPDMVTKRRQQPRQRAQAKRHLYISEWMAERELSDQALGDKMNVPRQTIFRWRTQEHRLSPQKLSDIAAALDLAPPDLWRPPGRQSIDAMLSNAGPEQLKDTVDFVERFVLKS